MRNLIKIAFLLSLPVLSVTILLFNGCASIQHPTGGPRDSIAPKILKETPKNFTTGFKGDEINIQFDEYYKLANAFKEISISPAMEKNPDFKVRKKILNIKFLEKLQDSTTYTINFGNALTDYNEGNILKNYIYVFSTGNKIDSLSVSGTVTNSLTKEPVLDATVFLLPTSQDSLFGKKRASLFTSTDSSGHFSLKYLHSNTYNIYALKEEGGDKIYNSQKELIGFKATPLRLVKDTADITLEIFKEEPKNFRISDRKIEKDGRITYIFNKQLEKPAIQVLQPADLNATKTVEFSKTNDTAFVWTQNTDFDSISVAVQDNKKNLDTVLIRRSKRDTYNKTITIADNIWSGRLKPGSDVVLTASAPIKTIDGKKITLLQDSIPVTGLRVSRDSLSSRTLYFKYPWKDGKQYIISIGENGLTGTYGGQNKLYTKQFTKDVKENYGDLTLTISVPDTSKRYIIQLLNATDKIITAQSIKKNSVINYRMLAIGKYYVRVVYDDNKNDKWDTGSVSLKKQPEEVWNYEKELSLKANWEIEETIKIPKLQ